MIRQARRKEIRNLEKELKKINTQTPFPKLLKYFDGTTTEEVEVLVKGECTDEKRQQAFNQMKVYWDKGVKIANRINYLKEGYKAESTLVDSSTEHPDFPKA